jgi:uncharacterized protein YkvS
MKIQKIHAELDNEGIYEKLRIAHSLIKDVIFMENYNKLSNEQKNAIDAIHSVLYMTEHYFTEF